MKVDTEALRRLMVLRGFTGKELARASEVSEGTVSQVKAGNTQPRPATLAKIAKALECDVAELIAEW